MTRMMTRSRLRMLIREELTNVHMKQEFMHIREVVLNNPDEMTHDDAVSYLSGYPEAHVLMNDLYITDAVDDEVEELLAGTSVEDALNRLAGEFEPEPEPEPEPADDEIDDRKDLLRFMHWSNGRADYDNFDDFYDYEKVDIIDLMSDENGLIEDPATGTLITPDEWMEKTNYDLYYWIPQNMKRRDGKSFDELDVDIIDKMTKLRSKEIGRFTRIEIGFPSAPQVGTMEWDAGFMFV